MGKSTGRPGPHLGARLAEVLDLHHVISREERTDLFAHLLHVASDHNGPEWRRNQGRTKHAQRQATQSLRINSTTSDNSPEISDDYLKSARHT